MRSMTVIAALVFLSVGTASAEIPQVIGYQGRITDNSGNPVPDADWPMQFRIYDAETGGSILWDSGTLMVVVSGGVFSAMLGESPYPDLALDFDQDYWLLVTFDGEDQAPRRRLGSVGYAYMASGLVPGTEVIGEVTTGTKAAIKGTNLATTGIGRGVFGQSHSTQGRGVWGWATATTGINVGVLGETASTQGCGVWGWATATEGSAYGVYGEVASTLGHAVHGYATATEGYTDGVYGITSSTDGKGVHGVATATSGIADGVFGSTASDEGRGVYGKATATWGVTYGVCGENASTAGMGVYGYAEATTGAAYGVWGESASTDGRGVYGRARAISGYTCGVYGSTNPGADHGTGVFGQGNWRGVYGASLSSTGVGVYGEASATTGANYGGYFQSKSTNGVGVYGEAIATTGTNYGGYFQSKSTNGGGVYALTTATTGDARAVFAESRSTNGQGVCGYASATSGAARGVYGRSNSTDDGCGVYGWASATNGSGSGVYGESRSPYGHGVRAVSFAHNGIALYATCGPGGYAADFEGNVRIRSRTTGSSIMELGEGLDYAEGFDVSEPELVCPGTVLVVDADTPGRLTVSDTPYDNKVAGIVAGANGIGSGVRLGASGFDCDVALAGRVYCNVDATEEGVEPGDLLTTSGTFGYAMKASDASRAHGAILGKAMESMPRGDKGQILVLVSLQ